LLIYYLVKKHTCEGDVVLDPMAGTSSTGIVASFLGRHSVCVELEEKFCEWSRRNVECLEKAGKKRGEIRIIQGDTRRLSELLSRNADVAITSPPYAETYTGGGDPEKRRERLVKAGYDPKEFLGGKARNTVLKHYGEVDVCLTSPPYSNAISKQGGPTGVKNVGVSTITARRYSDNPENIGNLPLGNVDAVITSPPYADGTKGPSRSPLWNRLAQDPTSNRYGRKKHPTIGEGYGKDKENIGNLPLGNVDLKKETYLQAMFSVYGEMFRVLKPGGLAVIIVKPFIRQKRVVDLPWHTWLLMAKAGFTLEKLYKLRLKTQSFWRILQYKKEPTLERIRHEYVIVAKKPTAA